MGCWPSFKVALTNICHREIDTVKSAIQLKPGETGTVEKNKAFCAEKLAPYKVPKIVEFRDVLPRSVIGKALKRVLRNEVN